MSREIEISRELWSGRRSELTKSEEGTDAPASLVTDIGSPQTLIGTKWRRRSLIVERSLGLWLSRSNNNGRACPTFVDYRVSAGSRWNKSRALFRGLAGVAKLFLSSFPTCCARTYRVLQLPYSLAAFTRLSAPTELTEAAKMFKTGQTSFTEHAMHHFSCALLVWNCINSTRWVKWNPAESRRTGICSHFRRLSRRHLGLQRIIKSAIIFPKQFVLLLWSPGGRNLEACSSE